MVYVLLTLLLLLSSILIFILLRSKVQYRILVCGSEGKTELSALLAASLNPALGEVLHLSSGKSMISGILYAGSHQYKAVICEFGFLDSFHNWFFGRVLFRPNICLVTNVRNDNPYLNIEDRAAAMLEAVPTGCRAFSSDIAFMGDPVVTLVAKGRSDSEKLGFLAEAVLKELGIGLEKGNRPASMAVERTMLSDHNVINAFGRNDIETISKVLSEEGECDFSIVYSNRSDRRYRLELLVPYFTDCGCREIYVAGDNSEKCAELLRKRVLGKTIIPYSGLAEQTIDSCCKDIVLLGGMTDDAKDFVEFLKK